VLHKFSNLGPPELTKIRELFMAAAYCMVESEFDVATARLRAYCINPDVFEYIMDEPYGPDKWAECKKTDSFGVKTSNDSEIFHGTMAQPKGQGMNPPNLVIHIQHQQQQR
jgi:hypothetical protein